ncbi:hypothetical protein [Sorangium sp. So ce1153]|uniref:hypothetical protein n=1 Tax=Sorangium sp. So ce1153 TaxID=3133333 RepID=UPI003F62BC1F
MAMLNEIYPNDLFRFMNVRPPQAYRLERAQIDFVTNAYDRLSAPDLVSVQKKVGTLHPRLVAADRPEAQLAEVDRYKSTADYITYPDDYATRFPALAKFLAWLDVNATATTMKDVATKFRDVFGDEIGKFVASLDFKVLLCVLWDNLLAGLLSPSDPFLVTLACKHLGGLHLAEVVAANPRATELEPQLWQIYRAKALLPKWVYRLLAARNEKADAGVGDQPRPGGGVRDAQARYQDIERAVQEVRALIQRRLDALLIVTEKGNGREPPRSQELSVDAFRLTRDEPASLSPSSSALLGELFPEWALGKQSTLDLERVIEALLTQSAETTTRLGSEQREHSVRVGNSIITRTDLCVEMIDKDPCALLPRVTFASRGSFVNSMLIGDCLVTRQQLIKYTPGEIAHVEALMMGLTKERTHRRLSRTESTTTTERESVNETERETQTTERFSMEKESSKTIAQDFKISTGMNVSGSYGVTTVTSNMDASFGMSSTQSAQNAVKFSRDVTTRALIRVKELVRQTQTVTVINETEETSLNKLSNTTNDAQNGVYRWLDKFYLNKIVNYGKRLMFEFAVPEPASFYLFRKLVKPSVGAVVEKPIPPSELDGPGGKLTSPAVLTDTNYTFWMAQYEAGNVEAPPQEYITFSRAIKTETGASGGPDLYHAIAAEIPLDDGYEAILGQANIKGNVAGFATAATGVIGTTDFAVTVAGSYTGNMALPQIQKSVALSLTARGVSYVLNANVKARRSTEHYEAWKVSTYGKILDAYNQKKRAYDEWLSAQYADSSFGFSGGGANPEINRAIEREELKKRCLELFTGQRWESFDAAVNGIQNASGYPEILFAEAVREGNLAKFFEQAFEWENMTYIFYPYFYGRKTNWLTLKNMEDVSDPLFTTFLQAGQARVMVPARPNFENFLLVFNLLANFLSEHGCAWNFTPSAFGELGVSNDFNVGIADPVYMSVTQELAAAAGMSVDSDGTVGHGPKVVGAYVQKVPTNLVYVMPNPTTPPTAPPGLPDNSVDPDIAPWLI